MAVVENEYTRWRGHTDDPGDIGRLIVWADNTGQRIIDRVEIDNSACTNVVRVVVQADDGTTMFDQVVAPGGSFTDTQARGQRWTRNVQQKISQWLVSTATWAP